MNWFSIWVNVGWAIFAIIIIGCIWLAYAMWRDAKIQQDRDISAPSLAPTEGKDTIFTPDEKKNKKPLSRKELRNQKSASIDVGDADESKFFSDDDDFHIASGKD